MIHRRSCFLGKVTDMKDLFTDTAKENSNDMIEDNENIELLNSDNSKLPKELIKKTVKLLQCKLE